MSNFEVPLSEALQKLREELAEIPSWQDKVRVTVEYYKKKGEELDEAEAERKVMRQWLIDWLEAHNCIEEVCTIDLMVLLIYSYTLPKDELGDEKYEELCNLYGENCKIFTKKKRRIPARTETYYEMDKKAWAKLPLNTQIAIAKTIGNQVTVKVMEPSKRALEGKPRG